jgi:hypothetical protein
MGPSLVHRFIKLIICMGFAPIPLPATLAFDSRDRVEGHDGMAGVIELSISDADVAKPMSIAQSRVERARILLGYREDPSFFAVAWAPELWDRIIRRFSGALSNGMDCPPITRSSGSGDLSAISQVTR